MDVVSSLALVLASLRDLVEIVTAVCWVYYELNECVLALERLENVLIIEVRT